MPKEQQTKIREIEEGKSRIKTRESRIKKGSGRYKSAAESGLIYRTVCNYTDGLPKRKRRRLSAVFLFFFTFDFALFHL
jgi:hypothetical protein